MADSPHLFTVNITLRLEFETGDDRALLKAINCCCLHNIPLPEWAAAAFVERYRRGDHGEIRSWDEVFGHPTRYGTMGRIKREVEQEHAVLEEVGRVRTEGRPLDDEEFAAIGRRLGVGGKTKVIGLLRNGRFWAERLETLRQVGEFLGKARKDPNS
jgi:hypothetical protein